MCTICQQENHIREWNSFTQIYVHFWRKYLRHKFKPCPPQQIFTFKNNVKWKKQNTSLMQGRLSRVSRISPTLVLLERTVEMLAFPHYFIHVHSSFPALRVCVHVGSWFPDQRSNLYPLQWTRVSTTRPPGKSLNDQFWTCKFSRGFLFCWGFWKKIRLYPFWDSSRTEHFKIFDIAILIKAKM